MLTTNYVPGAPNWVDLGTTDTEGAAAFYGALFGWKFQSAGPDAGGYGMFTLDGKTGAVRFGPFDVFTQGRMAGFSDPTGAQFAVWQPGETKGLDAVTVANTLCWTELHTTDPATVKAFYQSVFGWVTEDVPMGEFTYTVVRPADSGPDASQGGIMGISDEMGGAGMTPRWRPYFEVTDCDAVVAKTTEHGGSVSMPAEDVEGVGRLALLTDPYGAPFAVITSAST